MTEIETEVKKTKKRAKNSDQAPEEEPTQEESEQPSDNPFRPTDKPPKKKFKKSVTNVPQDESNTNEKEEDQVISVEGQLTTKPVLSKRQKKKLRKIQHGERNKDKEAEKAFAYLTKWSENRDEWKYEKLKQIYIQKHIFDENIIDDAHSEIAINYLTTSKGAARSNIVHRAEEVIRKIEDKLTEDNQQELTASASYKRAREILQLMQE